MTTTVDEVIAFIKHEWIPALRNGEYQQGQFALNRDGRYCCLGVACDLLKDRFNYTWVVQDDGTNHLVNAERKFRAAGALPREIAAFLHMDTFASFSTVGGVRTLTEVNDHAMSFEPSIEALEAGVAAYEATGVWPFNELLPDPFDDD